MVKRGVAWPRQVGASCDYVRHLHAPPASLILPFKETIFVLFAYFATGVSRVKFMISSSLVFPFGTGSLGRINEHPSTG